MQSKTIFVGVDVSKHTLDIAISGSREHFKVTNDTNGFKSLKGFLKTLSISLDDCWFVMEHTGGYEYRFIQFCLSKGVRHTRIPGLEIKRSLGMQRGKNDKVDAQRIATYGTEKQSRLKPHTASNTAIDRLKLLLRQRSNFVKDKKGHQNSMKEIGFMMEMKSNDKFMRRYQSIIDQIEKAIKSVEDEINSIIDQNEAFKRNFTLMNSIPGVGPINAWMTIAFTSNFENFKDGRKYGAYCGIVPYEHSSGVFKGRSHTSHIANLELKATLHMAAKAAVQFNEEMKFHYERKKALGKHHLSIMNEIMFKLVLRMFSVVKKGTPYVENLKIVA